jgi:hypothetical protein
MSQSNINLIKQIYGINTYSKVVDTEFKEFVNPIQEIANTDLTVDEFFQQYERLFYDIPVSGSINSHNYMIERSKQYVGGNIVDSEKQALIDEINSLRQQLLDINQTYITIGNISNIS